MFILRTLLSILIALIAILLALRTFFKPIFMSTTRKGDVFFISHGGPPHMYSKDSDAHHAWKKVGSYLTSAAPKGIVVVSAHWENEVGKGVIVNTNPANPLIYDFYGFPKHFYEEKFVSHGSEDLVKDIKQTLSSNGVKVREEDRGLDHGVWVPLKIGFNGRTDIPLVQVSLPGEGTPEAAIELGAGLNGLRDKGYAIVASGQPVHNLRDAFGSRTGAVTSFPYLRPFMTATEEAVLSSDAKTAVAQLNKNPHYKGAHPTDEHFLPLPVAVGATDSHDKVEKIGGTFSENLGWLFFRWSSSA